MGAPLADPCKIPDKVVRYKPIIINDDLFCE